MKRIIELHPFCKQYRSQLIHKYYCKQIFLRYILSIEPDTSFDICATKSIKCHQSLVGNQGILKHVSKQQYIGNQFHNSVSSPHIYDQFFVVITTRQCNIYAFLDSVFCSLK